MQHAGGHSYRFALCIDRSFYDMYDIVRGSPEAVMMMLEASEIA